VGVKSLMCLFWGEVVFKMDLRASLGFLMNIARLTGTFLYRLTISLRGIKQGLVLGSA
jgi:hypothetical protein